MTRTPSRPSAADRLQSRLGYRFRQESLLRQALTHRSFSPNHNERLEFVGDSILDYTIAKMLFESYPELPEGRLSPLRAALVKESTLADTARSIGLGQALYLGSGEVKSGGRDRPSILADALEAVFAAVSLDADFAEAEQLIRRLFAERVRTADLEQVKDAKTRLQEALQARRHPPPQYRIDKQTGEGNQARFDVSCDLGALGHISRAQGGSRRAAEQQCAEAALQWLLRHHPDRR